MRAKNIGLLNKKYLLSKSLSAVVDIKCLKRLKGVPE
jgi:hypothetical protein